MEPHGETRGPFTLPVFAFGYAVVIRLSFGATSRRSTTGVCVFILGQARGLLRRRIKSHEILPTPRGGGKNYPPYM
jgi:hypothetical protein